jgi:hypothetical protein
MHRCLKSSSQACAWNVLCRTDGTACPRGKNKESEHNRTKGASERWRSNERQGKQEGEKNRPTEKVNNGGEIATER